MFGLRESIKESLHREILSDFLKWSPSRFRGASGDLGAVVRRIGTRSAEEEVEDEIRDLKSRAARDGDSGGGARP